MNFTQSVRLWYYVFEHAYGLINVLIIKFDIQKHFFFFGTSETGPILSCENVSRAGFHNVVTQYNTLDDGWSPKEDSVWILVFYIPWELNLSSFLMSTNVSVWLVPLRNSL